MIENVPVIILLLIAHIIHLLYRSPLPWRTLAYAIGMLENMESSRPRHRRSGFVRTTSLVDAKRRMHLAMARRRGSGASGIMRKGSDSESGTECRGDEQSCDWSVESLDLRDTSRSFESTEMFERICDDQADAELEIMEMEQSFGVDLPESATVENRPTDPVDVSLSDFADLLQLEEIQNIPVEETPSSDTDTEDMSPCEPVELTQDPKSSHTEQPLDDPIDIEMDQIPQASSEEPPARNFLPRKKELSEEESSQEYLPLNLKIPAHARAKSNRRSLERIEPILNRKAKLPLGPADAPSE